MDPRRKFLNREGIKATTLVGLGVPLLICAISRRVVRYGY